MSHSTKSPAIFLERCDSLRDALGIYFHINKISSETFSNIKDAREYVERTGIEPFAFFSNFFFPESGSTEVLNLFAAIRAKWPSCPLVLTTAASPKSPGVRWLTSCLGVRLVRKPYQLSELAAAYREALLSTSGNQVVTGEILRFGESL